MRLTEPSVQVLKRYTLLVPVFTVNSSYSVSLAWQQDKPTIAILTEYIEKMGQDYYAVLGLTKSANDADIKKA